MITDGILATIGVLGCAIASYTDMKTREVPNWLSYSMIASALLIRFLHASTTANWSYLWYGLLGLGAMAAVGMVLYFTRQWGGGDTKLVMGLGALFATTPSFVTLTIKTHFLVMMLANIFILGAFYGVIMAMRLAVKNWQSFKKAFIAINASPQMRWMKYIVLVVVVIIVSTNIMMNVPSSFRVLTSALAGLVVVFPYLSSAIRAVERACLIKKIPTSRLTEGDWVEQDVYHKGKLIYKQKPWGIEEKDIQALRKARIPSVVVKEGIPFIPPFLLGLLWTLATGSIIFFA